MNDSVLHQSKKMSISDSKPKMDIFFDELISVSRRADRPKHREFHHRIEEINNSQNGSTAP